MRLINRVILLKSYPFFFLSQLSLHYYFLFRVDVNLFVLFHSNLSGNDGMHLGSCASDDRGSRRDGDQNVFFKIVWVT